MTSVSDWVIEHVEYAMLKLEPWASKTARHSQEGLDMQRNE